MAVRGRGKGGKEIYDTRTYQRLACLLFTWLSMLSGCLGRPGNNAHCNLYGWLTHSLTRSLARHKSCWLILPCGLKSHTPTLTGTHTHAIMQWRHAFFWSAADIRLSQPVRPGRPPAFRLPSVPSFLPSFEQAVYPARCFRPDSHTRFLRHVSPGRCTTLGFPCACSFFSDFFLSVDYNFRDSLPRR